MAIFSSNIHVHILCIISYFGNWVLIIWHQLENRSTLIKRDKHWTANRWILFQNKNNYLFQFIFLLFTSIIWLFISLFIYLFICFIYDIYINLIRLISSEYVYIDVKLILIYIFRKCLISAIDDDVSIQSKYHQLHDGIFFTGIYNAEPQWWGSNSIQFLEIFIRHLKSRNKWKYGRTVFYCIFHFIFVIFRWRMALHRELPRHTKKYHHENICTIGIHHHLQLNISNKERDPYSHQPLINIQSVGYYVS
jgi:hypothetical protein